LNAKIPLRGSLLSAILQRREALVQMRPMCRVKEGSGAGSF
jgi:hypothetical protein